MEDIMPNDDTIKLLRECNAGIKMAVKSLKEVESRISGKEMEKNYTRIDRS